MSNAVKGSARNRLEGRIGQGVLQSETDSAVWSPHWLGYSRYDGIVLTAGDIESMPVSVRQAIFRYVECGGALFVLGAWIPPASWNSPNVHSEAIQDYYYGFGVCLVHPTTDNDIDGTALERFMGEAAHTRDPFDDSWSVDRANREFPVVDDLSIPANGLIGLMALFAVVIGPVNLVWLARRRQLMWMLFTVPAISLAFCGAVWAYWVSAEGWTGHQRTALVTILDQEAKTAATLGTTAYYSPVTPEWRPRV